MTSDLLSYFALSGPSPVRSDTWWAGSGSFSIVEMYVISIRRQALALRRAARHPSFRGWILATGGRATGLQSADSTESLDGTCCHGGFCPRGNGGRLLVPAPSARSSAPVPALLSRADMRLLLQLISLHHCPSLTAWWGRYHFSLRTSFLAHVSVWLPR